MLIRSNNIANYLPSPTPMEGRGTICLGLRSFHTESDASSDAAMRLTEKIEHYIFQRCIHTACATQQCERIIEIYSVLIFPLVASLDASLCV